MYRLSSLVSAQYEHGTWPADLNFAHCAISSLCILKKTSVLLVFGTLYYRSVWNICPILTQVRVKPLSIVGTITQLLIYVPGIDHYPHQPLQ